MRSINSVANSRLKLSDITIGQPLPCDVRNKNRVLLLRRGWVITDQREIDRLIESGVFWSDPPPDLLPKDDAEKLPALDASAFRVHEFLCARLNRVSREIDTIEGFDGFIFDLIQTIRAATAHYPDALLATLQLGHHASYAINHQVNTAILVEMVALEMGVPVQVRNSLVAAALTMNISMLDAQDKLQASAQDRLPDGVVAILHQHPERSAAMLRRAGISDARWLSTVQSHHERLDGSGYPKGLRGPAVQHEAQIIGVIDMILAMMSRSSYRKGLSPSKVLWGAFADRGAHVNQDIVGLLIKVLGIYPPGTLVRLANHDLGVVVARGKDVKTPLVKALVGAQGLMLRTPQPRDTTEARYAIKEGVDRDSIDFPINPALLWD